MSNDLRGGQDSAGSVTVESVKVAEPVDSRQVVDAVDDGRPEHPAGYDLTRIRPLAWWLRRSSWQFQLILPNQILFWAVIVVGFVGGAEFDENFATTITWFVWFSLVFVLILLTGRGWCAVCPFGGMAEWIQRTRLWHGRGDRRRRLGAGRPVPAWLARHGYATTAIAFGVLTWCEEYFEVADDSSPMRTSWTVIGIIAFALLAFLAFERRAFCRYLCPLGGLIGVLGAGAPLLGFHSRDRRVCRQCTTKDCLRGNDRAYGCPWFTWVGGSESNVNCGLCGECFRACPSDNVGLYLGAPLTGLVRVRDRRADVAWTAAILAGVMVHQHLHETVTWEALDDAVNRLTGLPHGPNPLLFVVLTALYTAVLVVPAWLGATLLFRRPSGGLPDRGTSFVYRVTPFRAFFVPLFHAVIPLLGCDFLAVGMLAFTQGAPKVVPAAGRLLGVDAPVAPAPGPRPPVPGPELLSAAATVHLQVAVLALGALASAVVAWRVAGAEVAPVARSPLAVKLGGTLLMLAGGALLIFFYVLTRGEAG